MRRLGAVAEALRRHPEPVVLMVDDQPAVVAAVRDLLAGEADIAFHWCLDPCRALATAVQVSPTVILADLVMPGMDGLTLLRLLKGHPATRGIPVIVLSSAEEARRKAEAFTAGADDYLVKVPERVELVARIRCHSRAYASQVQRAAAHLALEEAQQRLAVEIGRAAAYVRTLVPAPVAQGPVRCSWCLHSCADLGGDLLGYHWLDAERLAAYQLDASGHGVGPALLSVSALNMIRSQSLAEADFGSPGSVLAALNRNFPMERQDNLYLTAWYGVYDTGARQLTWAAAGHPPAVLFAPGGGERELETQSFFIGARAGVDFAEDHVAVPEGASLYVFSDGVFQVTRPDGSCWPYDEFRERLRACEAGGGDLEACHRDALELHGGGALEDDYTILRLSFPG